MRSRGCRSLILTTFALGGLIGALTPAPVSADVDAKRAVEAAAWAAENPEACAMLDNPQLRGKMDGLLFKLATLCGRTDLLGGVAQEANEPTPDALGTDVRVNDPATDSGSSRTQSETSIAHNETTGTLCSGYNDSSSGVTPGVGYTGLSRSTDGGATWTDRGALAAAASFGDPASSGARCDGKFYLGGAALTRRPRFLALRRRLPELHLIGLAITPAPATTRSCLAVDNNPASPYYGRIYMAWTDFTTAASMSAYSDNGHHLVDPGRLSALGVDVQGAWPTVGSQRQRLRRLGALELPIAPARWTSRSCARPTAAPLPGRQSADRRRQPAADATATASCGRPALNGNIRYLPSPQIAVGPDGDLHVVYAGPRRSEPGDVVNVYYRRSTDSGATWGPEVLAERRRHDDRPVLPHDRGRPRPTSSPPWYDRRLDSRQPAARLLRAAPPTTAA